MKKNILISLAATALLVGGCGSLVEDPEQFETIQEQGVGAYTIFDSVTGNIPYPNNIFFSGSKDGTLNIPYNPNAADASVKEALNSLDGFSTQGAISISFTQVMSDSTLAQGVNLYEVNNNVLTSLVFGVDFFAKMVGTKLIILPIGKPLKSNQNYIVALNNKITDAEGLPLHADAFTQMFNSDEALIDAEGHTRIALNDAEATQLEGIRQLTQSLRQLLVANGIDKDSLVTTWSFKTQTIGKVTSALMSAAQEVNATLTLSSFNGLNSNQVIALSQGATPAQIANVDGNASMFVGTLNNIPYYLGVPTQSKPFAAMQAYFDVNMTTSLPKKVADLNISALAAIPKGLHCNGGVTPTNGWPVVIFQHGVTVDRTVMLAVAETLTRACQAVVAIDLPLHGIVDVNSSLYQAQNERHFNLLDLDKDGDADSDDTLVRYVNLASLRTTRDNMRQSASDFVALTQALKSNTLFDANNTSFIGHSLGTISALPFLTEANLTSVTFAMPGGGIAELFSGSTRYGPTVRGMLQQAAGIEPDSAEYQSFLLATQTMIDDADPINYAIKAGEKQKATSLAISVVGNQTSGGSNPSDLVIPNSVATAPLAGTNPFFTLYDANKSITLFAAEHSSLLTPAPVNNDNSGISASDLNASFFQLQSIVGTFIGSKSASVGALNPSLAEQN